MNRTTFKSFARTGMSMSTMAISIASAVALTGCGSTGGAISKTGGSGVSSGTATSYSTPTKTGTSTGTNSGSITGTGTNTGSNGKSPNEAAKQSATGVWDGIVGGTGNVVMQAGDTVSELGEMLVLPASISGSPVSRNAISSIVTGAGGAIYGVGLGLTTGLDGLANGTDPVDVLALSLGEASTQVGQDVSAAGSAIGTAGTGLPYASVFSPTFSALASSVSAAGVNLSAIQFESAAMLTEGSVQQLSGAVTPVLFPVATGAIEIASAIGDKTGLGTPLNTLITQTGDVVAALGSNVSSASSSPVVQGLGSTVTATGETVAAVGGVAHDGQATTITPIHATSGGLNGIFVGVENVSSGLPGGTALTSSMSGSKGLVTPALTNITSAVSTAFAPLATALGDGATVVSSTAPVAAAPIVAISTTLSTSVMSGSSTPPSAAVPVLAPVTVPVTSLATAAGAVLKSGTLASLATAVAHPGH